MGTGSSKSDNLQVESGSKTTPNNNSPVGARVDVKIMQNGGFVQQATENTDNTPQTLLWNLVENAGYFNRFPTPQLLRDAQGLVKYVPRPEEAPFPPHCSKDDIFKSDAMYKLYEHVQKTPNMLYTGEMEELVSYLIKPTKDEVSRVTSLFRWVSSLNLDEWDLDHQAPHGSPADYINRLKLDKMSHEVMFGVLCSCVGIPHKVIDGYAKSAAYEAGDTMTSKVDNQWSAVYVQGSWRLAHVFWSSCHIVGTRSDAWETIGDGGKKKPKQSRAAEYTEYRMNDYYFLTDPEEFVFCHYPKQKEWQLLARPLNLREFEDVVYLRQAFFEYGFQVASKPKCVLYSEQGRVNIDVGTPAGLLTFKYNLYMFSKGKQSDNVEFDRYVYLEHSVKDRLLNIAITFPKSGKYKFVVYSEHPSGKSVEMNQICSYVINCDKPQANCKPLPKNERQMWGPSISAENVGLTPVTHSGGTAEAYNGEAEIRFRLARDIQFVHRLFHEDEKEEVDSRVVHRVENGEVIFNAKLKEPGNYALQLYARKEDEEKNVYRSVCNYLLKCDEGHPDKLPYPEIDNEFLGPTESFSKLSMKNGDNSSAFTSIHKSGTMTFRFKLSKNLRFLHKLFLQQIIGEVELRNHVFWRISNGFAIFHITFPKPGMYKFRLYVDEESDAEQHTNVYNAFFNAFWVKSPCFPFPIIHEKWSGSYHIREPLDGYLPSNKTVQFSAFIPDAVQVAVIAGGNVCTLTKRVDGYWDGDAEVGDPGSDAYLSANYKATGSSFIKLLQYKIKSLKELQDMSNEHEKIAAQTAVRRELDEKRQREIRRKINKGKDEPPRDEKRSTGAEKNLEQETSKFEPIKRPDIENDETGTSNVTRKQMRQATNGDNYVALSETIRSFESEHLEEIDGDLGDAVKRKKILKMRDETHTEIRRKLHAATKGSDLSELERSTKEFKENKLHEVDNDLRDAKRKAQFLRSKGDCGQKEDEIIKPYIPTFSEDEQARKLKDEMIRDQMRTATIYNHLKELNVAIEKFEATDLAEDNGDLTAAKQKANLLRLKGRLVSATSENNIDLLKSAIDDVESSKHSYAMQYELSQARIKLQTLERVARLGYGILQMKQTTIAEIRGYVKPPYAVHHVMQAALLLLGHTERSTSNWKNCQNKFSTYELHKQVLNFDLELVNSEIAARAREIMSTYTQTEITNVSAGAGTFYVWANGIVAEVLKNAKDGDSTEPADRERQKTIFAEKKLMHSKMSAL